MGQAEIQQLDAVARQKHIGGLQVAVNNAEIVQGLECVQHLPRNFQCLGSIQHPGQQTVGERKAIEQLHHQDENFALFEDIVDLADVGMIYAGQRPCFAPKPAAGRAAFFGVGDGLDGDRPLQPVIPPLVHHAHRPLADLLPDPVVANGVQHGEMIAPGEVFLRAGVVAGGSVNRRHLAAHGPNISAQLAAVVDGIEKHEPQQVAKRSLPG